MKKKKQDNEIITINTIKDFIKQVQNIKSFLIDYRLLKIFMRIIRCLYRHLNIDEKLDSINLKKIEKFYTSLKNINKKDFRKSIKSIDNKLKDYEIESLYQCFIKKNEVNVLDVFISNIWQFFTSKTIIPYTIIETLKKSKRNILDELKNRRTYLEKLEYLKGVEYFNNKELSWLNVQIIFTEIIIELYEYLNNIEIYENFNKIREKINDLKKKNNLKEIKYFMDNIGEIYNQLKNEYKFEIVFRAPSKKLSNIEDEKPSLFKNEDLIANERVIYKDFLAYNPNEFENMTTFDILTKMRHYEVPNRLLDVTYDLLLALFFACGEDNKGSKTVFLYTVKEKNIKYYDSDTITILSILSKLKYKYKKNLKLIVDNLKNKHNSLYSFDDYADLIHKLSIDKSLNMHINISKYIYKFNKKRNANINEKSKVFSKQEIFNFFVSICVHELDWQLKKEIPSWNSDVLNLDTFTQCYLVKPKMNNPRIIAQSGAFFIYPFEDTDIETALVKKEPYKIYKINSRKIKEELNLLNIKETKYIPDDLTVYAKEIKER